MVVLSPQEFNYDGHRLKLTSQMVPEKFKSPNCFYFGGHKINQDGHAR